MNLTIPPNKPKKRRKAPTNNISTAELTRLIANFKTVVTTRQKARAEKENKKAKEWQ